MNRKRVTVAFSAKTPRRGSYKRDIGEGSLGDAVKEELELDEYSLVLSGLVKSYMDFNNETLLISAIFFQRLCARTPLDEDYSYTVKSKDGKEFNKSHSADDDFTRYHWEASCMGKRVTAKYFQLLRDDFFKEVNNREDVMDIYSTFKERFFKKGDIIHKITFKNDSKKFSLLEYGEYKNDSSQPKEGDFYEHGIQSHHSIQAPAGMLRITDAEREEIFREASNGKKYLGSSTGYNLDNVSRSKMKSLLPYLKKEHFSTAEMNNILRMAGVSR